MHVDSLVVRHVLVLESKYERRPSTLHDSERRYLSLFCDDENIDIFIEILDVEHVSINQPFVSRVPLNKAGCLQEIV